MDKQYNIFDAEQHLMHYSPSLDATGLGDSLVDTSSVFTLPSMYGADYAAAEANPTPYHVSQCSGSSLIPNHGKAGQTATQPSSFPAPALEPAHFPASFSELPLDQIDGIQGNHSYSHALNYHPAFYAGLSNSDSCSSGSSLSLSCSIPSPFRYPPYSYSTPSSSALRNCSLSYDQPALVNPGSFKGHRRNRSASAGQLYRPPSAVSIITDDGVSTSSEAGMPIEKRLNHIQNEKRRRVNMQEAFKNLQNSVPQMRDRKICRATLLSEAVSHIRWLKWQQSRSLGLRLELPSSIATTEGVKVSHMHSLTAQDPLSLTMSQSTESTLNNSL